MTAPPASEAALRDHLAVWLGGSRRRARTLLVRAQPVWSGPPTLEIEGRVVRVVEGVSGLAALDAIRSASEGEFVAVLTELDEAALGSAVVLDAEHRKLTDLNEWSAVPALFSVRDVNIPRPVRELGPWVPRLLAAWRRERTYPAAPGGNLSAEHVVRALVMALLGFDRPDSLESAETLTPLDDLAVRVRLSDLDPEARDGFIRAIGAHIDPHLAMAVRAALAPGRLSVVAVGLVVAELWPTATAAVDPDTAAARVRIERFIGAAPIGAAAVRFGEAARVLARRWIAGDEAHARDIFEQAEALCGDLGWIAGAAASTILPAGFRARTERFAESIVAATAQPSTSTSLAVDAARAALEAHEAHALFDRSMPTALMAARLVRWLAEPGAAVTGLGEALLDYGSDGAWAERALGDLWDGDSDRTLAAAYQSLAQAVQARRRRADLAAAAFLTGAPTASDDIIPVEHLLAELVVPLSASRGVLLIVLDGMSAPTAIELASELESAGWTEIVRTGSRRRGVALAALPTLTEYSRTSLFAGELTGGNQRVEKSRFASAVNGVLFHKDDLRSEAGHVLPPAVADELADSTRKIVGAVLNTIDDALASADVDALRWTLRSVANLEALLSAARAAGRSVVLASDHGHVVERGSELRTIPDASARWRTPQSGAVQPEEVAVEGPRVLAPGNAAVLAVSDGVRYAAKKAGYHGGASLAELTIPLLILAPRGTEAPEGWVDAPPQEPTWWNEPSREQVQVPAPTSRAARPSPPAAVRAAAPTLFDPDPDPTDAVAPSRETDRLAVALVESATYRARLRSAGRHPVDDAAVVTVIETLLAGSGRAHRDTLAAQIGVPSHRFGGDLSALRRLLNVDGYAVLDVDADDVTVILDSSLLREQFELGSS